MISKNETLKLLKELAKGLVRNGAEGEIGIVGGVAVVLAYDSREATKDVSAIFKASLLVRKVAAEIAKEHKLAPDWLNDAVMGLLPGSPKFKTTLLDIRGLKIWVPEPVYLLVMKVISARPSTQDRDDLKFLVNYLKIKSPKVVLDLVENYYPYSAIPASVTCLVESLFEAMETK